MALVFVLLEDRLLELLFLFGGERLSGTFGLLTLDLGEHACGLLAAHHRDACVWPHPQETRIVGTSAHAVVTGAEAAADDYGEFRYLGAGHRSDQLGAVLGDEIGRASCGERV